MHLITELRAEWEHKGRVGVNLRRAQTGFLCCVCELLDVKSVKNELKKSLERLLLQTDSPTEKKRSAAICLNCCISNHVKYAVMLMLKVVTPVFQMNGGVEKRIIINWSHGFKMFI